jgi:hypothetical protein
LFLDSSNGKSFTIPDEINLYKNDLDITKLNLHLQMLPDVIRCVPINGINVKQVTRISTICDIFNEQPSSKKLLSEVHTLLKIYLTIPVTTSTAERSFSALKRIIPTKFNDTKTSK